MEVNLIVAIGKNGEIGRNGDLVWHISEDLKHFKAITTGHPVIMGRKTWESLPKRPLPGRRNVIVTRNPGFKAEGAETVTSPEEALKLTDGESPFIIGGGEIYNSLLPFVTKVYLTKIDESCEDADTFLELLPEDWETVESEGPFESKDGVKYTFETLKRVNS